MAGDIWEQAVETYLAMDRGLFLNPQYLIGTPNVWEANPDFMALAFPEKTAWMVEVTKRPRVSLFNKIRDFEKEYFPRIRHQLQGMDVIHDGVAAEWKIGLCADSDEAGHAFQYEAGHLFRSEAGQRSDLKPATCSLLPQVRIDDVSPFLIGQERMDFRLRKASCADFLRPDRSDRRCE